MKKDISIISNLLNELVGKTVKRVIVRGNTLTEDVTYIQIQLEDDENKYIISTLSRQGKELPINVNKTKLDW